VPQEAEDKWTEGTFKEHLEQQQQAAGLQALNEINDNEEEDQQASHKAEEETQLGEGRKRPLISEEEDEEEEEDEDDSDESGDYSPGQEMYERCFNTTLAGRRLT
jgi:hypothetical protein